MLRYGCRDERIRLVDRQCGSSLAVVLFSLLNTVKPTNNTKILTKMITTVFPLHSFIYSGMPQISHLPQIYFCTACSLSPCASSTWGTHQTCCLTFPYPFLLSAVLFLPPLNQFLTWPIIFFQADSTRNTEL